MAQQKYGDDFKLGDIYTTPRITVTETHVVNWAGLTGDYYPLHMDKVYAESTQFGERLAHGPMIFALAVGLVAQAGFGGDAVVAWLGANNMRMLAPVKIGDTITVRVEVKEQKVTRDPKKGVQTWAYTVLNQRNETVVSFDYIMMFHQRGTEPVA
jgi:acyl dehydratase